MKFYLGTHHPDWLGRLDIPLFVSRRRLVGRKTFPRARMGWSLDSGGFTELSLHGQWTVTAKQYVAEVRRIVDEVGNIDFVSIQDWMCEPFVLAKTGLSVEKHQEFTVQNYLELRAMNPSIPWLPVVQGYTLDEYRRCIDLYADHGVDLTRASVVGLGSVCRRQASREIAEVVRAIAGLGIRLHGFGVKKGGLTTCHRYLTSADSMAWSFAARRSPPLPGCTHKACQNCPLYAMRWYRSILEHIGAS